MAATARPSLPIYEPEMKSRLPTADPLGMRWTGGPPNRAGCCIRASLIVRRPTGDCISMTHTVLIGASTLFYLGGRDRLFAGDVLPNSTPSSFQSLRTSRPAVASTPGSSPASRRHPRCPREAGIHTVHSSTKGPWACRSKVYGLLGLLRDLYPPGSGDAAAEGVLVVERFQQTHQVCTRGQDHQHMEDLV